MTQNGQSFVFIMVSAEHHVFVVCVALDVLRYISSVVRSTDFLKCYDVCIASSYCRDDLTQALGPSLARVPDVVGGYPHLVTFVDSDSLFIPQA